MRTNGGLPTLILTHLKMAALRILAQCALSCNESVIRDGLKLTALGLPQIVKRWTRFRSSPLVNPETKYTDYEISRDPKEWAFVEQCMKPTFIPAPPKVSDGFSSGWKAQKPESKNHPYFIERSKNHQQSVYLHKHDRGLRRTTVIKKIQGDIVALEADLKKYLEELTGDCIGSQIFEPNGVLKFRGDYVSRVREWMDTKGF